MQINQQFLMPTYKRHDLQFTSGQGVWLTDHLGDTYLDCVSGVAVNALGHQHPAIKEAIIEQTNSLMHVSNLYFTKPQLDLAKNLCQLSGLEAVFLSNSGTESVEAALKIARKYGKSMGAYKTKIIHVSGSFHGRTLGSLTVTANVNYQAPFLPLMADTEECPVNDVQYLTRLMSEDVCAVIMEPIQGESGVNPIDIEFIATARALATQHKALLIFDEVQCGISRTGTLFHHQSFGIQPDVLCLAKGLGAGYPIGATLVNATANCLEPGDHGSTFGGNPLACAVANTVLGIVATDNFLNHVTAMGQKVKDYFAKNLHPSVAGVTGSGLLLGIQLSPEGKDAATVVANGLKENLLLIGAGPKTVRFLPPLNITEAEMDTALERLTAALSQ